MSHVVVVGLNQNSVQTKHALLAFHLILTSPISQQKLGSLQICLLPLLLFTFTHTRLTIISI